MSASTFAPAPQAGEATVIGDTDADALQQVHSLLDDEVLLGVAQPTHAGSHQILRLSGAGAGTSSAPGLHARPASPAESDGWKGPAVVHDLPGDHAVLRPAEGQAGVRVRRRAEDAARHLQTHVMTGRKAVAGLAELDGHELRPRARRPSPPAHRSRGQGPPGRRTSVRRGRRRRASPRDRCTAPRRKRTIWPRSGPPPPAAGEPVRRVQKHVVARLDFRAFLARQVSFQASSPATRRQARAVVVEAVGRFVGGPRPVETAAAIAVSVAARQKFDGDRAGQRPGRTAAPAFGAHLEDPRAWLVEQPSSSWRSQWSKNRAPGRTDQAPGESAPA